jgi:micrococcal nuclease
MRRPTLILLVSVLLLSRASGAADRWTGTCVDVLDGDTIAVEVDGEVRTVRLDGIDAPEIGQPFGDESRAFTSDLLLSKVVTVSPVRVLDDGMTVGRVSVGEVDASHEILVAGLAWHDSERNSDENLVVAMIVARGGKVGLWSESAPEHPRLWLERQRRPTPAPARPTTLSELAKQVELQKDGEGKTVISGLPAASSSDKDEGAGTSDKAATSRSKTSSGKTVDFSFMCPLKGLEGCAEREFKLGFAQARPGEGTGMYSVRRLEAAGGKVTILFSGANSKGQSYGVGVACDCADGKQCSCLMKISTAKRQ